MSTTFAFRIAVCIAAYALSAFAPAVRAEVVPVVSARSPVTALNAAQLVDIFLGKESRFPNGEPAVPIDLYEGSEARDEFYSRYTGRSHAELKSYWSKLIFTGRAQPPRQAGSVEKLRKALSENPHAIGYMQRHEVDSQLRIVEIKGK